MTNTSTIPDWPRIQALTHRDGSGELTINGTSYPIETRNTQDARAEIVRCTGSQFDPGVVDALFARMDRALDDPDRLVPVEVVTAGDLMGIDWTKLLLSPSPMTRAHAWT